MQDKNCFAVTVSLAIIFFLTVLLPNDSQATEPLQHELALGPGSGRMQLAQADPPSEPPRSGKPPPLTGVPGRSEPPWPEKPSPSIGVPGYSRGVAKPPAKAPVGGLSSEMEIWRSIKNSNNPADFEAYLKIYPDGEFALLAKNRLRAHRKEKEAPISLGVYTAVSRAPVRSEPRADGDIVSYLRPGMKVRVVGQVGNYLEVRSKHGELPAMSFGRMSSSPLVNS